MVVGIVVGSCMRRVTPRYRQVLTQDVQRTKLCWRECECPPTRCRPHPLLGAMAWPNQDHCNRAPRSTPACVRSGDSSQIQMLSGEQAGGMAATCMTPPVGCSHWLFRRWQFAFVKYGMQPIDTVRPSTASTMAQSSAPRRGLLALIPLASCL